MQSSSPRMNCPDCGTPVEKEAQFCPKCYARIEPPTFWQKLLRLFQGNPARRQPLIQIKKTISIKTTGPDGQQREYSSLDELPPELRAEFEKAEAEGLKEVLRSSSSDGRTTNVRTTLVSNKKLSLFKVRDASGNERTYHSLEEMPPEVRAAFEEAQRRQDDSPKA
jgi:hypothetical protein